MPQRNILIKPASSLCNLRCKYCFYADISDVRDVKSYGIMSLETAEKLIQTVYTDLPSGDSVSFAFQGGEPTLAGLDFFQSFVELVKKERHCRQVENPPHYALQTNGVLLDDNWCAFLHENNFLVGLSLDGDAALHNQNRVDEKGKGSFARVMNAKRLLDAHKVEYNVLCVLTNHVARHAKQLWRFLREQHIRYVQFIPCLSELSSPVPSPYALSPERFASFYTELFRLWAEELQKDTYISVKFFDDIMNLLIRRQVTACGFTGQCQSQIVVEADGTVFPCDFYAIDGWKLGNLTEDTIGALVASKRAQDFLHRPRQERDICKNCKWQKLCGGGCPRMEDNMYVSPQGNYCGYQDFLTRNAEEINRVAADICRRMR